MNMSDKYIGEFILYQTEDGRMRIECRFEDNTLWLSQALMADLFQATSQNITLHLKDIYAEGEQTEEATCKSCLQVRQDGERSVRRQVREQFKAKMIERLAIGLSTRSSRSAWWSSSYPLANARTMRRTARQGHG